jgi:hypothetical protein
MNGLTRLALCLILLVLIAAAGVVGGQFWGSNPVTGQFWGSNPVAGQFWGSQVVAVGFEAS